MALRKKDKVVNLKRRQKQANYFEIGRISTMLSQWPSSSFLGSSVVNLLNKQTALVVAVN